MGKQTECVGIAIEMNEVAPFLCCHHLSIFLSFALTEIRGNGTLAAMSERWVAHVVRQASGTDDGTTFCDVRISEFGMQLKESARYVVAQRTPYAGHFEGVCQAVVDEDAAWERKDLSLVLQTTEWSREDESVVIALEFRAVVLALDVKMLLAETYVGNELMPVHGGMMGDG